MTGNRPRKPYSQEHINRLQMGADGSHPINATTTGAGTYDGNVYGVLVPTEDTVCTVTNLLTNITETSLELAAGVAKYGLFKFDDITVASGNMDGYIYKP